MSERSVDPTPQPGDARPPFLDRELLSEAVETVLARLYEARPHLESRISRAAGYLVVQLSSSARTRPIRVRVRRTGRRVILVSSLNSAGVAYEVNPADWSCSCPDHHRRGAACKHSLAAWTLAQASTATTATVAVVPSEAQEAPMPEPDPSEGLTHAEARRWLEAQTWHVAVTSPHNPHSYCLRREAEDPELFEPVVEHIREFGHPYPWWGTIYLQYPAGDFAYWTMGAAPRETILVNRKTLEQVRRDELTNKGGGGVIWEWLHEDVEADRAALRREEQGQDELGGGA